MITTRDWNCVLVCASTGWRLNLCRPSKMVRSPDTSYHIMYVADISYMHKKPPMSATYFGWTTSAFLDCHQQVRSIIRKENERGIEQMFKLIIDGNGKCLPCDYTGTQVKYRVAVKTIYRVSEDGSEFTCIAFTTDWNDRYPWIRPTVILLLYLLPFRQTLLKFAVKPSCGLVYQKGASCQSACDYWLHN